MKKTFKRIIPSFLWKPAGEAFDAFYRLPELPAAYFHRWRRESMGRIAALRDGYTGERAFIIGNGPSLRRMDLGKLRGEYTFGLNRIYLLFPELGFSTTFFVSINDLVIEQCMDEILALPMPKFLSWRSRRFFSPGLQFSSHNINFIYTTYTGPRFSERAAGRLWEGATVTYVALQLAFHMGFKQVILIGVDHNFSHRGSANQVVTSEGRDLDHFHTDYFGKGFRWQLPDLETSERAYCMADRVYKHTGRKILDATVDGKLTVFPKVSYESLF